MRVLVTGATGFIGKQLTSALCARGDEVTCLVRGSSNAGELEAMGARIARGDVVDAASLPGAIDGVDIVYHLAGCTRAHRADDYLRVNEGGVRNVLEACASRATPPTVLLVSSLAAAGAMENGRLREENDPPLPVSMYGQSKRAGERVAEEMAGRVPVTIVRPPIVLGPGDKIGVGLFRGIRIMNRHLVLGMGRRMSVVYVADLVKGMIAAAERGERLPSGEGVFGGGGLSSGRGIYFVSGDKHPTYVELGQMVGRAVDRPEVRIVKVPRLAMWAAAVGGEIVGHLTRKPRYMGFDRAREITAGNWTCSSQKAHMQLGYAPGAPLEKRISQTARWYLDHGWI